MSEACSAIGTWAPRRAGGNRPDRAVTGEVNGQKVQFHYDVDYDGNNITVNYTGTLESDTQIKGTVETSGTSGEFTATKE